MPLSHRSRPTSPDCQRTVQCLSSIGYERPQLANVIDRLFKPSGIPAELAWPPMETWRSRCISNYPPPPLEITTATICGRKQMWVPNFHRSAGQNIMREFVVSGWCRKQFRRVQNESSARPQGIDSTHVAKGYFLLWQRGQSSRIPESEVSCRISSECYFVTEIRNSNRDVRSGRRDRSTP